MDVFTLLKNVNCISLPCMIVEVIPIQLKTSINFKAQLQLSRKKIFIRIQTSTEKVKKRFVATAKIYTVIYTITFDIKRIDTW